MPEHNRDYKQSQHLKQHSPNYIGVRFIQQVSDTKATILIVDRKIYISNGNKNMTLKQPL